MTRPRLSFNSWLMRPLNSLVICVLTNPSLASSKVVASTDEEYAVSMPCWRTMATELSATF